MINASPGASQGASQGALPSASQGAGKIAFVFGLGYSGRVLARELKRIGFDEVRGTTRNGDVVEGVGVDADIDIDKVFAFRSGEAIADSHAAFAGVSHVLSTIAVIDGVDPVLEAHGEELTALQKNNGLWAGYVSATSVYAESSGGWVDEDSPAAPIAERGRLRLAAETGWSALDAEIFRAAGIYGPGRSPFGDLLRGTARIISKPGHAFNRIHVEDMARVMAAAMLNPSRRRVLNLADGHPAEAGDVMRYAAELLGVAPPGPVDFDNAELSAMARSFYATSRKVANGRIKNELGIDLLYPDYKAGLEAVLAAERAAGIISRD